MLTTSHLRENAEETVPSTSTAVPSTSTAVPSTSTESEDEEDYVDDEPCAQQNQTTNMKLVGLH